MPPDAPHTTLAYDSAYWSVCTPNEGRVIEVTRHRKAFESAAHVHEVTQPVQEVLDRLGRSNHTLLIDSRDAPPRNDPAYESWFTKHRTQMVEGFPRVAVLMGSMAGVLQTSRLAHDDETLAPHAARIRVFQDEAKAQAFLRSL